MEIGFIAQLGGLGLLLDTVGPVRPIVEPGLGPNRPGLGPWILVWI